MIDRIGQKPGGSGKLLRMLAPKHTYLLSGPRTAGQETSYRRLLGELNARHGYMRTELNKLQGVSQIKERIITELTELFHPSSIDLASVGALSELKQWALKEARLLFIPKRDTDSIFVSGQHPNEASTIFEFVPKALEIDPAMIPAGSNSLLIVPLIGGLGQKKALEEYIRLGVIIMFFQNEPALSPQVELPVIRMLANDYAATLLTKNLTLL